MASNPQAPTLEELTKLVNRKVVDVKLFNPAGHPGQMALVRGKQKRKIVRAGRRGGKTLGSAILAVEQFLKGKRVLYAAPTIDQVQAFWKAVTRMLHDPVQRQVYKINKTEHSIELPKSESRIRAKTAWNAETLRGDYADVLILDEWQMMDETAWSEVGAPMLMDNNGDVIFIYTPPSLETRSASKAKDPRHAAKMFKEHEKDPLWLCIHFPSHMNPHISEEGLEEVSHNMTVMAYRQEILAEDTEEIPGALWTRKIIEDSRHHGEPPEFRRIVVGIDPSGGNTTEVGIVAAGEAMDGQIYVLYDRTMKAPRPKAWAQQAINLYYELQADRVVGENNYGGAMVEETLRSVDENISYKDVNATRGKLVRAEPVLARFQQNRMHLVCRCGKPPGHCIEFAKLEEEMCSYTAEPGQKSPNRMDAMVWCGIELSGMGTLGLLDLVKSGKMAQIAANVMNSGPGKQLVHLKPASVAGPATATAAPAENKLRCPNEKCGSDAIHVVAGGQQRCRDCGTQWFDKKPEFQLPLGGRRLIIE